MLAFFWASCKTDSRQPRSLDRDGASGGRLGRPTVQFQREATGACSALVGELRHGGEAATGHRQSQPRDARGYDRHDASWRTRLNSAKVNLRVNFNDIQVNLMVAR